MKENMKIRGQLRTYLQWPIILSVFLLAANLAVGIVSPAAGLVMSGFTVIYVLVALWLFMYRRKRLMGGLVEFSAEYAWVQKQLLYEMAVPYAIADTEGHFLWLNHSFSEIVGEDKNCRKNIAAVFPELTREFLDEMDEKTSVHSSFDGRFYRIDIQQVALSETEGMKLGAVDEDSGEMLLVLYLCDETEILRCKQQINNQRLVAGLIYLDNYDEALESVEEVRRSLLVALIDRKITKYFMAMEGIVKKLENDKYLFVIKQQYTKEIQESRFSILEDVKTVNIGNDMAVTLSIGMGMNGDSYIRNYEYARTAIDMALGRGGDQAAEMTLDGFTFYGGVSHGVEKRSKVRSRLVADQLVKLIKEADHVVIMGHRMSDLDAIGAAEGVLRICKICDVPAVIAVRRDATLAASLIDALCKAGQKDDFIDPKDALPIISKRTLCIVVDTYQAGLVESKDILEKCGKVAVIDHHRKGVGYIENPALVCHEPYSSSASELVTELLQYVGERDDKPNRVEAEGLLAGILLDTQDFTLHTGVRTFEAAAALRRYGAETERVRRLFDVTMVEYNAKADLVEKAQMYKNCAISIGGEVAPEARVAIAQAANDLLRIQGVDASFVAVQVGNGVNVSARSMGAVNVQVIMESLGGGGHQTMAAAQLKHITPQAARSRIQDAIDQYYLSQKKTTPEARPAKGE